MNMINDRNIDTIIWGKTYVLIKNPGTACRARYLPLTSYPLPLTSHPWESST
jgi:hypothetical protein